MKLVGLAASAAIIGIGIAAVKTAADMESLSAEFEVMLGSAEKSKALVDDLIKFAARTPFQVQGLSENARTLLQFGFSVEELMPTLQMLGDVAGKNSQRFQSLTFALGKVNSQGKLTGLELKQMIIAGFNPLNIITKQTGETMSELRKRMSQGGVSAIEVANAFKVATAEGGMFYKNMEKQSLTFLGLVSTMKDNISLLLADFGKIMLPILKDFVTGITNVVKRFRTISPAIKKVIIIIAGLIAVATPLIIAIGAVTAAMATLNAVLIANPIGLVIIGIAALIAALIFLWFNVEKIVNWFKRLWTEGGKIRKTFIAWATAIFFPITALIALIFIIKKVIKNFARIKIVAKATFMTIKELIQPVIDFHKEMGKVLINLFKLFKGGNKIAKDFIWNVLIKGFKKVVEILNKVGKVVQEKLNIIFEKSADIFKPLFELHRDMFQLVAKGIFTAVNFVISTINKLITFINDKFRRNIELLQKVEVEKLIETPPAKAPANITVQNQINIAGKSPTDKEGIKKALERTAGTVFNMELKKLIVSAGGI